MGPIQRYPVGLLETLSIKGLPAPSNFGETIAPTFETLQFYGLAQLQTLSASDAALAEGAAMTITIPAGTWGIFFGASATFVKTATLTALIGTLSLFRGGASQARVLECVEFTRFGATDTGSAVVAHVCPYPLILPPGTLIQASASVIGTDATIAASVRAEVGLLN